LNLQDTCSDSAADGALDAYGDNCAWYNDYVDWCGFYDDDDFLAARDCCACGGGAGGEQDGCQDTSNYARDAWDDECRWYANYPEYCGFYDDDDFTAAEMCCSCGGGSSSVAPLSPPEWEVNLDYDQAEVYATDLAAAYEDLNERMIRTWSDW